MVLGFRSNGAGSAAPPAPAPAAAAGPLTRNGYFLVGSTLASSLLGVGFWVIAARRVPPAEVGIDAALISTMGFLTNLSALNLTNGFNRFVPTAGREARRLVRGGYAATLAVSALVAIVFIAGARIWTPDLAPVVQSPRFAVFFAIATMVWTIFVLQDAVLTGFGRARWVLLENALYGVVKILLLLALVLLLPHHGVFTSWTLASMAAVVPVTLLLFRLFPLHDEPPLEHVNVRSLRRFLLPDYAASLLSTAAATLPPVIVLGLSGSEESAEVYLAFTIAYSLYLVSRMMGMSLITEASRRPEQLVAFTRHTLARTFQLVIPLALVLAFGAHWWLELFREEYAAHATGLLRLLAVSAIPCVITTTYLSVARVQRRMLAVVVVTAAMSVGVLGMSTVLLSRLGIAAVGWAWLVTQAGIATVLLLGDLRSLWLVRVPAHRLRDAIPGAVRVPAERVRSVIGARRARTVLEGTDAAAGYRIDSVLGDNGDVQVLALRDERDGARAVLRVARTPVGDEVVRRVADALTLVEASGAFADGGLVPRLLARSDAEAGLWTLETMAAGTGADALARVRRNADGILVATAQKMRALYERTSTRPAPAAELVAEVDEPLEAIRLLRSSPLRAHGDMARLRALCEELSAEVADRSAASAFVHGDLWLGNVLCDPAGAVCSIIDWDCARRGLPSVELMHLVCTTRSLVLGEELGAVVRRALARPDWRDEELELVHAVPGGRDLEARTLLLLAWLRHVDAKVRKSSRVRANGTWVAHNVQQVIDAL